MSTQRVTPEEFFRPAQSSFPHEEMAIEDGQKARCHGRGAGRVEVIEVSSTGDVRSLGMLCCNGCGGLVSEFAARCAACGRPVDDAVAVPEASVAEVEPLPLAQEPRSTSVVVTEENDSAGPQRGARLIRVGRTGTAVLVFTVVALAASLTGFLLSSGGQSTPVELRALTGRVMAEPSPGVVLSVNPADGASEKYKFAGGAGVLTRIAISSDGRTIIDATGSVFEVKRTRIVKVSAVASVILSNSTTPAQSAPFADRNHSMLVVSRPIAGSAAQAILLRLSDGKTFDLGTVDNAGGDAQGLSAFASIPAQHQQPRMAHPIVADAEVDLLRVSGPPIRLATSSQLNVDVGSLPSIPIQMRVYPDPSGDAVAVVLDPVSPVSGNVPMVILDRQGHVLAALADRNGPIYGSTPAWSPNSQRLAYPSYGNSGAILAVSTESGIVGSYSLPGTSITFGRCIWSPNSIDVLCLSTLGGHLHWLYATPTTSALITGPSHGLPLAWTAAGS